MEIKDRVRALRLAMHLSQTQLADRTGGELDQSYLTKIESGKNRASTVKVREALARGFNLDSDVFSQYLDGTLSLEAAVDLATRPPSPSMSYDWASDTGHSIIEEAIATAFASSGGKEPGQSPRPTLSLKDMDFVRAMFAPLTDKNLPSELRMHTWSAELAEAMFAFMSTVSKYPPERLNRQTLAFERAAGEWPPLTRELLALLAVIDAQMAAEHYLAQLIEHGIEPVNMNLGRWFGRKFLINDLISFYRKEGSGLRGGVGVLDNRLDEISADLMPAAVPVWTEEPAKPTQSKASEPEAALSGPLTVDKAASDAGVEKYFTAPPKPPPAPPNREERRAEAKKSAASKK